MIAETDLAVPALAEVVDVHLCRLIERSDEEFLKVKTWMESREFFVLPFMERRRLTGLVNSLLRFWPDAANLHEADARWRAMKKAEGLPEQGCEVCGRRDCEPLHLLAEADERRGDAWNRHRCREHPANCIWLCPGHRAELCHAPGSPAFRELLAHRKRLNAALRRQATAELVAIRQAGRKARNAWQGLERAADREVKRLEAWMTKATR
jgi:hypothetical protein